MKNILPWVKGHWVVVVCGALIVLSLPLAFFFSQRWNNSIRTKQEKAANDQLTKLTTAGKVSYSVPSVVPHVPPLEQTAEPNAKRTAYFKAQNEALKGQASGVVGLAEQYNARDHKPLMEGIFPDPPKGGDVDSLTLEFAERIVGRPAGPGGTPKPSAYQKLFESINAGPPADGIRLGVLLDDQKNRTIERIKGTDTQRALTADEVTQLNKELVETRIGEYQRRAREISVYGTMDALPGSADAAAGSWVPREMPKSPPQVWETFAWQFDYWVIGDLLAAVAKANTGGDGRLTDIEHSVVKRIEKIKLDDAGFDSTHRDQGGGRRSSEEEAAAPAGPSETGLVPVDFKHSLTGRYSAPENSANGVYDVRRSEMIVVVSSERLPQLLNAISATNFMTVLDCDLAEVNVWSDLAQGYYYGNEHVVRATLSIESVWLRSATKPYMPIAVRKQLGIPDDVKPEEEKKEPGQG